MTKKLMLKQLASMLASFKRKKKYYCEVEYIESTEKDSFFPLFPADNLVDSTTTWEVRLAFNDVSSTGQLMGYGYSGNNRYNLGIESNKFRFAYSTNWFDAAIATPDTNPHTWKLEPINGKDANAYIDGQVTSTTASSDFGAHEWFIGVGGRSTGSNQIQSSNQFGWKLYYSKIWKAGRLVLDVIPVLDWDMKPCLYDRISDNLIYATIRYIPSAGGEYANVTTGREIHYVDYLESTGTQYIDTGIYLTNNHSIEIDYQLTSTDLSVQARKGLYGGLVTSRHGALLSPTNRYLEAGYGEGNNYYQLGMPDTNRHVLYQKKNELYFDGALTYTFATATFTQASTAPLGSFDYTNYNPAYAKYYSSRWWDGNTLVRNYKPAIDENGICFWFDRVTHTIYDNAGTDAFKYSAREVEYLESTGTQWINTGINVDTSTDEIKLYFELKETENYKWFFGEYDENKRIGLGSGDGTDKRNFLYQQSATKVSDTRMYNTQHLFEINSNGGFLDGTKIRDYLSFASTSYIYLFNLNIDSPSDYRCKSKIWGYEHKRNGILIRNFIPCYKDGVACMVDKLTGTAYLNQGTGTFVTGKVKESEYLE